jgi:hypothetical protein
MPFVLALPEQLAVLVNFQRVANPRILAGGQEPDRGQAVGVEIRRRQNQERRSVFKDQAGKEKFQLDLKPFHRTSQINSHFDQPRAVRVFGDHPAIRAGGGGHMETLDLHAIKNRTVRTEPGDDQARLDFRGGDVEGARRSALRRRFRERQTVVRLQDQDAGGIGNGQGARPADPSRNIGAQLRFHDLDDNFTGGDFVAITFATVAFPVAVAMLVRAGDPIKASLLKQMGVPLRGRLLDHGRAAHGRSTLRGIAAPTLDLKGDRMIALRLGHISGQKQRIVFAKKHALAVAGDNIRGFPRDGFFRLVALVFKRKRDVDGINRIQIHVGVPAFVRRWMDLPILASGRHRHSRAREHFALEADRRDQAGAGRFHRIQRLQAGFEPIFDAVVVGIGADQFDQAEVGDAQAAEAYVSQDGVQWQWIDSFDLGLSGTVYAGVFLNGREMESPYFEGRSVTALFDNLTLEFDADQDGLYDAEEIAGGTNPGNADTDGDGFSDWVELYETFTNPLVADLQFGPAVTVGGSQTTQRVGEWIELGSGALLNDLQAGSVQYQLNAAEDKAYWLELEVANHEGVEGQWARSEVEIYVDGQFVNRLTILTEGKTYTKAGLVTPWLTAGPHDVRVALGNYFTFHNALLADQAEPSRIPLRPERMPQAERVRPVFGYRI